MNLKPYSAYKDSGVPWLGKVPELWEVRRIKTLFHEKNERSGDRRGVLLSMTRVRGIVPQAEASNRIASAEDLSNYKVCRPGDLVMNRMQAWSGMFAVSHQDGLVSPDYSVFKTIGKSYVEYFEHLFKTSFVVEQFAQRSKGIGSGFNRLYTPDFGSVPVVVPPFLEQAAIVRFLDYVDHRIKKYIRAKQKLIKLLEEQKQAIINDAVTGKIDVRTGKPYPKYKDSGIEWLGMVPEHWKVRRLKNVFRRIIGGSTPSSAEPSFWNGDIVWVTPRDVSKSDHLWTSFRRITRVGLQSCSSELVPPGSIIVTSRAPVGNVAIANVELCTNQGCKALVVSENIMLSAYAFVLMRILKAEMQSCATGTTFTEISKSELGAVAIPLPALPEQIIITTFLNQATENITTTIAHTFREISLLYEYRTRMIANVVTGKLDVREAAERLPEEIKMPEEEDQNLDMVDEDESPDNGQAEEENVPEAE